MQMYASHSSKIYQIYKQEHPTLDDSCFTTYLSITIVYTITSQEIILCPVLKHILQICFTQIPLVNTSNLTERQLVFRWKMVNENLRDTYSYCCIPFLHFHRFIAIKVALFVMESLDKT